MMPLSSVFSVEQNPTSCIKKEDHDDADSNTDKESTESDPHSESMTWLRRRGLDSTYGKKECRQIPIQALYENGGSALYEQIEQLPEYYPYREEKRLLQDHSQDIERFFSNANKSEPTSMVVIELGCGDCTKTSILLSALQEGRVDRTIEFVGIDCSFEALDQAHSILSVFPRVHYTPICANFLEGLSEAIALFPDRDLCVLFLGATIGNMSLEASQHLLQEITSALIATDRSVSFLLGVDVWKDSEILTKAYFNDITEQFEFNGLKNALCAVDPKYTFDVDAWKYVVEINQTTHEVQMWAQSLRHQIISDAKGEDHIHENERILVEVSHKFTPEELSLLLQRFECFNTFGEMYKLILLSVDGVTDRKKKTRD